MGDDFAFVSHTRKPVIVSLWPPLATACTQHQQFSVWQNLAIEIAATEKKVGLRRLFSVGEGRLCPLLVQIYLPPQIKLRIADTIGRLHTQFPAIEIAATNSKAHLRGLVSTGF